MKPYLLLAMLMTMLAACTHELPPQTQPVSVEGPLYRFNVARVDVIDDFNATPRARTDFKPDITPAQAMHQWADRRLSAAGQQNVLEVHITRASITKRELGKQKTGLEGFFTKEQTEEYDGKLAVELKLYTPERTLPVAHAEMVAEMSRTLREDATLLDRKALYNSLTAELMEEMNKALDRNIRSYFSNHLM